MIKLILLFLLTSCATLKERPEGFFDPELLQMKEWYEQDAIARGFDITPKFEMIGMRFVDRFPRNDGPNQTIAVCSIQTGPGGYTTIEVSREDWDRDRPFKMRALVYHELTHCIYLLDHSTISATIMYGTLLGLSLIHI